MTNKIALGTAQFGLDYGVSNKKGKIHSKEIQQILQICVDSEIDTLDTASAYGDAEAALGASAKMSKFKVITKTSPAAKHGIEIEHQFYESLFNLGRESVQGLLIHDFDIYKKNPQVLETLCTLKEKKKVSKIGFSVYFPEQAEYLLATKVQFDIIQLPYNILDDRFGYLMEEFTRKNIAIHTRSTFLQGLFFLPREKQKKYFPGITDQMSQLGKIVKESGIPLNAMLLNYSLMNPNITKVIIGVESLDNLIDNIQSVSFLEKVTSQIKVLKELSIADENVLLPFRWKLG
ncbi:MAG: aldo/keto reductase [Bacteroidota bacterium]